MDDNLLILAPEIVRRLSSFDVREDETTTFTCTIQSENDEPYDVRWYYGDKEILSTDKKYSIDYGEKTGICLLTIHNVTIDDEGAYRCIVTNKYGSSVTTGFLAVISRKRSKSPSPSRSPGRISSSSPSRSLSPSQAARERGASPLRYINVPLSKLERVTEELETLIAAEHINEQEKENITAKMNPEKVPVTTLNVDDVKIESNLTSSPELTITSSETDKKKEEMDVDKNIDTTETNKEVQPAHQKPIIVVQPPSLINVKEGEDVHINSTITGIPEPNIRWLKGGNELREDHRIDMYADRGVHHLEICEAQMSDNGVYELIAQNNIGKVSAQCEIKVEENENKMKRLKVDGLFTYGTRQQTYKAPEFIIKPSNRTIHEGEIFQIFAKVIGIPPPEVVWMKLGKSLRDDGYYKIYDKDGQNYLEIPAVSILDSGEYTCLASNMMGAVYNSFQLHVEDSLFFIIFLFFLIVAMTEPDSSEFEERSANVSDSEQSGKDNKSNTTNVSMVATELIDKHVRQHRQSRLSIHSGEQSDVEYFLSDFILKEDYCDDSRDVSMNRGDIVEIVDVEKKEKWLVRNKKNLNQICYVPPELLEVIPDVSLPSDLTSVIFDEQQETLKQDVLRAKVALSRQRSFTKRSAGNLEKRYSQEDKDSSSSSDDIKTMTEETEVYFANSDYQPSASDGIALVENQFVDVLDNHDPEYFLVRTKPRKDEKPKVGWVHSCFLEKKSTNIGQFTMFNPTELSSFIYPSLDEEQHHHQSFERSLSEIIHERHQSSPSSYYFQREPDLYCHYCPCRSCRLSRSLRSSYLHMSRRSTSTSSHVRGGRQHDYYSSSHSLHDSYDENNPNRDDNSFLNEHKEYYSENYNTHRVLSFYNRYPTITTSSTAQWQNQPRESSREKTIRFSLQINRRNTREVYPDDITPIPNRYEEAIVKQRYVFADIVESERQYVSDLEKIIEIYLSELTRQGCPWFIKEKKDVLFSNIENIFAFHKVLFLTDLINSTNNPTELANTFLKHQNKFELYTQYAYDKTKSDHLLQTNSNIQDYFDDISRKIGGRTLNELLNEPIQRLEKYKAILQELIKYTIRMKEDATVLQQAYTMIAAIMNEARNRESIELIDQLPINNSELGELKRYDAVLIKDEDETNRLRERFLYLFRNKIVICRRKRAESKLEPRSLAYKNSYNISEITFIQENFPDDDKKFEITFNDNEKVTFHARNVFAKMSLIRSLREILKSLGFEVNDIGLSRTTSYLYSTSNIDKDSVKRGCFVEEVEMIETATENDEQNIQRQQRKSIGKKRNVDVLESVDLQPKLSGEQEDVNQNLSQKRRGNMTRSSDGLATTSGTSDFYSFSESESSYQTPGEDEFKPKFLKKLNDTLATEGDYIVLECLVISTTPVHGTWFKNNIPLQDNSDCRQIQEDRKFSLIIKEAFVDDGGIYSIKVSNHAGTITCSCKLFIREQTSDERTIREEIGIREETPQEKRDTTDNEEDLSITEIPYNLRLSNVTPSIGRGPIFIHSLMPLISNSGDVVTLKCAITALPMPDATWLKNGIEIHTGGRYSVFNDGHGNYSLVISDTSPDDTGVYEINVQNSYGVADSKTSLQILERESVFIPSDVNRVNVQDKGTAKLSLTVKRPDIKVQWIKDERILNEKDNFNKYKITSEGLQRELIVRNVTKDDQGDYICQSGKYRVTLHLNVRGPPADIVQSLENIEVIENNEAIFECQLSIDDAQVEWYHNNQRLINSNHHIIASRDTLHQLIIPHVNMNDEGEYSIRVDNKNTSTGQLYVKEQSIVFRRSLRSQTVEEGSTVLFECELNKPLKHMLWFKSNTIHLLPSDKYSMESYGLIHRLTIRNVDQFDEGDYMASTGFNKSTAHLSVEQLLPIFIVPLMDARANITETVKLSCETSTPANVIWYHREKKILENNPKYTISKMNGGTLHTLDIDNLDQRDQGEVVCAIKEYPAITTSAHLLVEDFNQQCVYTCVTREGQSSSTTLRTLIQREHTPRSEERYVTYMRTDSPRMQTPELGLTRSSLSPGGQRGPRYVPSMNDDETRFPDRFEETQRRKKIVIQETSEQRIPTMKTITFRPSSSRSLSRDYSVRSGDTSPEKERSLPRQFSPSAATYARPPQLQDFGHYLPHDRSESPRLSPSPSPTRKTSMTFVNMNAAKLSMPPVYEELDEHQRHRSAVTFSPSQSPARTRSQESIERKTVMMEIPIRESPRRDLKHAPYQKETIPEEHAQFIDSEAYDRQTPFFQREERSGLTTSRVNVTEPLPIHITRPLVDTYVEQGKPLRLVVETSFPSNDASWFKTDSYSQHPVAKKLDESDKYRMISQGSRHMLIIPNVTSNDSGDYICRIQNLTTKAHVQVNDEDLQFMKRLPQTIDVIGGRDIAIECEMNHYDTQALWKKDNEPIKNLSKFMPIVENKKHKLIIKDASAEDSGLYTVNVNELESTTYLNITQESLLILKPLQDQRAKLGDNVTFTCVCSKAPKTVQWYINGIPLPLNVYNKYQIKLIDREIQLTINNISENDIGTITCCLNNTITTANLTIDDTDKNIKFLKLLDDDDMTIRVGSPFILECRINHPNLISRWYKDGKPITEHDKTIKTISDGCSHVLQVDHALEQHTGHYRCLVQDKETSCHITVHESDYRFVQSLPSHVYYSPNEGTITLNCTINHSPTSSNRVKWFKNELEIKTSPKYETIIEHHLLALIIHDLNIDDQALYRCEIDNAHTECQLIPTLNNAKDILLQPLQDVELYEHDMCTLTVKFLPEQIKNIPQIKWYRNGQAIKTRQDKYRFIQHSNENTLIIDNCLLNQDNGYYSVRLNSNNKQDLSACYVNIKDLNIHFVKPLETQRYLLQPLTQQQVQLDCETTPTDKKPSWYFNNTKLIQPSNKYELIDDSKHHRLIINNITLSDQGQYHIEFPNSDQRSYATVQILQTPNIESINFIQPLDETFLCEEGDDFTLVTKTNKPTASVNWMKNGYKLIKTPDTQQTDKTGMTHRFVIKKCRKQEDEGNYVCYIDTTNVATECFVKIIEKELQIIQPLPKILKLNENDTLTLLCETNRKPKNIRWLKNNSQILDTMTNPNLMLIMGDETCTMIINNVTKNDSGSYTCQVEDKWSVCDVRVQEAGPQFVDGPQSYLVWKRKEDGPVTTISCTLNKFNVPVKWFKENHEIYTNDKYELISEGTIQCLLIHDINKNDSGKYVISLGSIYRTCHLEVVDDKITDYKTTTTEDEEERLMKPIMQVQRQEVMEGDSLTIEVTPDSTRSITADQLQLLKNNRPIDDYSHISLEREDTRWLVRLVDVDLLNTGLYSIDIDHQRQDLIDLYVKKRPVQRQLIELPKEEFFLNETITLECNFQKPIKTKSLQPTWFRNGRPIQSTNRHIVTVDNMSDDGPTKYSLTIKNVDYTDEGIYELRTDYLIVETPLIRIVEKPKIPAPNRMVIEGDSLQIDVNIDRAEHPNETIQTLLEEITLLKDNRPITTKPQIEKWHENDQLRLELKNLQLDDYGLYEIDIHGERTPVCQLDVKEREPEVFILDLDKNSFEEGETIRLACTFPQRPGQFATWLKDGIPIVTPPTDLTTNTKKIEMLDENNTLTIIIRNVTKNDSGVYEVRIGSVIARAPMIYVVPKRQREPQNISLQIVRENDTVTLSVEGLQFNLRPNDIQLLKDGEPLNKKPKSSIEHDNDKLRITLQTLALDDSGVYSVKVQNDVHPLARIKVEKRQPEIQHMQLQQDTFYVGDTVTLDLEFTHEPQQPPTWSKDDVQLHDSNRVSMNTNGNKVTLVVRDLQLNDAGVYEVQSGPLIVQTPYINVIERPKATVKTIEETTTYSIKPNQPEQPKATVLPHDKKVCTVKEGDSVTLKIASTSPITTNDVQLLKNNQPTPVDNKHVCLEQFGGKDVRLSIIDAQLNDAGDYTAIINNQTQHIITLNVIPRQLQIQMIDLPTDTFVEGDTLEIECRFQEPTVNNAYHWYKGSDGKQLVEQSPRVEITKDNYVSSLIIKDLRPTDADVYELRSPHTILRTPIIKIIPHTADTTTNVLSQQEPIVSTTSYSLSSLEEQPKMKLVHEGDTVTFELTPSFDVPLNKIELLHNNTPITHEPIVNLKKDYKTNSITVQLQDIGLENQGIYTAVIQ
ncbi:unnamed protein product, partial [Didymodactylos carnosus]